MQSARCCSTDADSRAAAAPQACAVDPDELEAVHAAPLAAARRAAAAAAFFCFCGDPRAASLLLAARLWVLCLSLGCDRFCYNLCVRRAAAWRK